MKKLITGFCLILVMSMSVSAQQEGHPDRRGAQKEFYQSLSDEQKGQLDYHRELQKEHQEKMGATFTEEQKAIAQNPDLSRRGKYKSLRETYSEEQLQMAESHKQTMEAEKDKFKATLNEEQLAMYESLQKRKGRKGHKRGRKGEH